MVDVLTIQENLNKYFTITGPTHIHPETGVVDVSGSVELIKVTRQLPVQFGKVTQNFSCSEARLERLVGSPHTVGEEFMCNKNYLTTLEGGPNWVGGSYWCEENQLSNLVGAPRHVGTGLLAHDNLFQSLEGMPEHIGTTIWIQYHFNLPLLRLLMVKNHMLIYASDELRHILNKYKGQGKPGAIKAAAELIKAGFKDNARW